MAFKLYRLATAGYTRARSQVVERKSSKSNDGEVWSDALMQLVGPLGGELET